MKNRSHGYDIKRNLGVDMDANILNIKYDLAMMVIVCTKQHITNIWSSVCERVKLRKLTKELSWVWKKRVNEKKSRYISSSLCIPLRGNNILGGSPLYKWIKMEKFNSKSTEI